MRQIELSEARDILNNSSALCEHNEVFLNQSRQYIETHMINKDERDFALVCIYNVTNEYVSSVRDMKDDDIELERAFVCDDAIEMRAVVFQIIEQCCIDHDFVA